jgi:hypothetical protein
LEELIRPCRFLWTWDIAFWPPKVVPETREYFFSDLATTILPVHGGGDPAGFESLDIRILVGKPFIHQATVFTAEVFGRRGT